MLSATECVPSLQFYCLPAAAMCHFRTRPGLVHLPCVTPQHSWGLVVKQKVFPCLKQDVAARSRLKSAAARHIVSYVMEPRLVPGISIKLQTASNSHSKMVSTGLSEASTEAIGYVGGGVLAICLIPQIGKIVLSRSARDISTVWSLLYMTGLSLSLVYLILKNAMAAWIPLVLEIAGCLVIISLKYVFEHTESGRRWSLQKQLPEGYNLDVSVHSLPGISHVMSVAGAIEETSWRAAVDRSWHGEILSNHAADLSTSRTSSSKHCHRSHVDVECCQGSSESSSQTNAAAAEHVAPSKPAVAVATPATELPQRQQQQQHQRNDSLFPAGWQSPRAVHPIDVQQQQQQRRAEEQC